MSKLPHHADVADPILALQPRGAGHQFLLYGDSCSGVPDALHEKKFSEVNAVVRRLQPAPEFIIFPGDEIIGLTPDRDQLVAQWRHWIDNEMRWLDRRTIPMWHATGNHTTYDEMSEQVFREVLGLPRNGPAGQQGLSYWVRRGDLLLVFVNTLWSGLGGEGFVETQWLEDVLRSNGDAHHKLVVGHHPVFSVNGYSGPWQRDIEPAAGAVFWDILVRYGVRAYLCSHILAFDVQVHRGVLQICTAGAGTAHRMPEDVEYLHCVQVALDASGIRYQVLDTKGAAREALDWRFDGWHPAHRIELSSGSYQPPVAFPAEHRQLELAFSGTAAKAGTSRAQTLLCAGRVGELPPLWIGLRGTEQRLTAIIHHSSGRSPHYWFGPCVEPGEAFELRLQLHADLGAGGLLYRMSEPGNWTSMSAASPWGPERLRPCDDWHIGRGCRGPTDRPFAGNSLAGRVSW
jgi:hypothetical protein